MRLINAVQVVDDLLHIRECLTKDSERGVLRKALRCVEESPTVDAVEVVRCKDCQAWSRSPYGHPTIGWCIVHGRHRAPDYFCASAKKRESVEVKVNG